MQTNVIKAIEELGGVCLSSSSNKIKEFLLCLYENGDLEVAFDDSVRLTEFGEGKFQRGLDSFSDVELDAELAERGIPDFREMIHEIQYRKQIGLDVSREVEELMDTP